MSKQFEIDPDCNDKRKCFGATYKPGGFRTCHILTETYERSGQCPFCKEDKDVPNHNYRRGREK